MNVNFAPSKFGKSANSAGGEQTEEGHLHNSQTKDEDRQRGWLLGQSRAICPLATNRGAFRVISSPGAGRGGARIIPKGSQLFSRWLRLLRRRLEATSNGSSPVAEERPYGQLSLVILLLPSAHTPATLDCVVCIISNMWGPFFLFDVFISCRKYRNRVPLIVFFTFSSHDQTPLRSWI